MGDTYSVDGTVTVAVNQADVVSIEDRDLTGFSLYTFANDESGVSNCNSEGCVTSWPPLIAEESASPVAPLSVITRTDGLMQWALRGQPLYFFANDNEAGDVNGQGAGGVWSVAVDEPTMKYENGSDGVYLAASGTISMSSRVSDTVFEAVASAPYSIIERTLGSTGDTVRQWAAYGYPLYFFANDVSVGDTNGKDIPNWDLARPVPTKASDSSVGTILTAAGLTLSAAPEGSIETVTSAPQDGMSLYVFDNDQEGVSNCSGNCLANWPALMAAEGAEPFGNYTLVTRNSGQQWALNGMPLYFFANDFIPGDVNGDQVGGVWHLARKAPVALSTIDTLGDVFTGYGNLVNGAGDSISAYQGHTLYTFANDVPGVSNCFGGCQANWPPLYAAPGAKAFGDFTVIRRDNPNTTEVENVYQWALNDAPLYFFANDTAPGEANGNSAVWPVATIEAQSVATSEASAPATTEEPTREETTTEQRYTGY